MLKKKCCKGRANLLEKHKKQKHFCQNVLCEIVSFLGPRKVKCLDIDEQMTFIKKGRPTWVNEGDFRD